MEMEDEHEFGEKDYIDADDYKEGDQITIQLLQYLGRREYNTRNNEIRKAAYYKASLNGKIKEWRLGIKNEYILKQKFGYSSYEDLVGSTLTLQAKAFRGTGHNGFVVVDAVKGQPQPPTQQAQEDSITQNQINLLNKLANRDNDTAAYIQYALEQSGVASLNELSKQQASTLIDTILKQDYKKDAAFQSYKQQKLA